MHLDPILRKIKRIEKPLLPILNLRLEDLSIGTALHRLRLDDLVVQDLLHFVYGCTSNDESASIAPFLELDIDRRPIVLHLADDLFNTELLLSILRNDLQLWDFIENFIDLDQFSYIQVLVGIYWEVRVLAHLRPMPLLHSRVAEYPDEWGKFGVIFDLVCQPVEHLEWSLKSRAFLTFFVAVDRITGIEPIGQFQRFAVHLLDLLLDELGVQFEDGRLDPGSVIIIEGADHAPKVDIGLDLCACSLKFGELDLLPHLQSDDVVVDNLLCLFKIGDPTEQLIDLGIGIVFFETFSEFFQLADLAEQVGDVCVQLLDHVTD